MALNISHGTLLADYILLAERNPGYGWCLPRAASRSVGGGRAPDQAHADGESAARGKQDPTLAAAGPDKLCREAATSRSSSIACLNAKAAWPATSSAGGSRKVRQPLRCLEPLLGLTGDRLAQTGNVHAFGDVGNSPGTGALR